MKLLLFDIDGTLMLSGGAGRRAIDRTFFEIHGIKNAFGDIVPDGNTDPAIFREIFTNHGLELRDESSAFAEVTTRYAFFMRDEMARSEQARLMPGVTPLLDLLGQRTDIHLGLLTGNFETTARIKLDRFGLNDLFAIGAFGSDDGIRSRLVPIAVERAEAHFGHKIDLSPQVVVIGDTPQDVECALVNGVTAVGVAASRYSVADLEAAGAHCAMPTLEDIPAFMKAITQ